MRNGTRAPSSARRQVPMRAIRDPSGEMIALSPVVDAYTTARSLSIARIRAIATCCSVSPSWLHDV
jgi:hypothetical protein